MQKRRANLGTLLVMSLLTTTIICCLAKGKTIYVDDDGPADYNNIQASINDANHGDIIEVQPGIYTGVGNRDIDFKGKAITVRGATGDPNDCVINCQGTKDLPHRGFNFVSGEDGNSVLEGFTITNGYGPIENIRGFMRSVGGAIYCKSSGPTINNCVIIYNAATHDGGGINNSGYSTPTIGKCTISNNLATLGGGIENDNSNSNISNCVISGNSATSSGGGIYNYSSNPTITKCVILNNSATSHGGGTYNYSGKPTITKCAISNNTSRYGGGISNASGSISKINNCTINNNAAISFGGGIYNPSNNITLNSCIIWGNQPSQIRGTPTITYSDIQGGAIGVGNINADPCFVDDYHLSAYSPCIDAGDPNYISGPNEKDIDGDPRVLGRLDMGADEFFAHDSGALFIPTKYYEFQALGIDSNIPSQLLSIKNYGALELNWQIQMPNNCDWLRVSALSGQTESLETSELSIGIDHNNIDYGAFSCQLTISEANAQNSPQFVTVNLEVLGPELTVSPAQFYFETSLAEPNTTGQILSIQNTGYDTLNWDVNIPVGCNWLNASEISGQSTGELDEVILSIDHNNVDRDLYHCDILISAPDAENSPQVIPVELMVLGMKGQRHVPAEYPTIQAAIDAAVDGDEVIIEPGRYAGPGNYNIDFRSQAITVRSIEPTNPAVVAATIIEPNTIASGFRSNYYGGQADSVIDGLTIKHCIDRPAIWFTGGSPTIRNCIIEDNYNYDSLHPAGTGIKCNGSSVVISNCVIRNNQGSGLQCSNGEPTVRNCIFTGNRGSYSTYGGFVMSLGGGILLRGGNLSVINCTFSGNAADVGGGVCSYGWKDYSVIMTISNCIFRANDANDGLQIALIDYKDNPLTVSVSYSDVQGGEAAVYVDPCCTLEWGKGNIDIDPCFAKLGHWELSGTPEDANDDFWVDGDYHLKSQKGRWKPLIYTGLDSNNDGFINQFDFAALANSWRKQGAAIPADFDHSGIVDFSDLRLLLNNYPSSYTPGQWLLDNVTSPCIDAGDPNLDRAGELWPHGSRINMGAYGGRPEASMSFSDAGNIADLIPDGCVGYTDIMMLTHKWLYEGFLLAEDLDRNNFVNFTDLAIFAGEWGVPCEADYPSPADGATDVNLTINLSWTPGRGATSHDVYFGTSNPPFFTGSQTATTFDPGTMAPGTKYYWLINEVNPWATTTGPVWSFTTMFLEATNPNPADGATDVSLNADLSWTAGYSAASHDVYFGTSNPPPFVCNQAAAIFEPGTMIDNTTYYWRIDEVGTYGTITGALWSFSTYTYIPPPPPPPPPPPT